MLASAITGSGAWMAARALRCWQRRAGPGCRVPRSRVPGRAAIRRSGMCRRRRERLWQAEAEPPARMPRPGQRFDHPEGRGLGSQDLLAFPGAGR